MLETLKEINPETLKEAVFHCAGVLAEIANTQTVEQIENDAEDVLEISSEDAVASIYMQNRQSAKDAIDYLKELLTLEENPVFDLKED